MVVQNGLQTLDGARVLKPCCCNSDNCKQYCDNFYVSVVFKCRQVATVITASSIVTDFIFEICSQDSKVATVITARDSHFFVKKCVKKLNRYSDSVAYVQRVPMVKR